ncbi:ribonuclease H2 subunit B [Acrasis kona]|uniref:Ribonuclease H2 subunit B n=1 Tax=Acrasis kona TaxID=1008807 RepID=A0AAW2Z4E1_9EUKA
MSKLFVFHTPGNNLRVQTDTKAEIIDLQHPKFKNITSKYCILNNALYEVKVTNVESKSSWIVDDQIISDGSLYCVTPFDVAFLLIQLMDEMKIKEGKPEGIYRSINDVLSKIPKLTTLSGNQCIKKQLKHLCDVEEVGNDLFYRLNQSKVEKWLKSKVEQLIDSLKKNKSFVEKMKPPAKAFRLSVKEPTTNDTASEKLINDKLTTLAVQLTCEYIDEKWVKALAEACGVGESILTTKTTVHIGYQNDKKRDINDIMEDYSYAPKDDSSKKRKRDDGDEGKPKKKPSVASSVRNLSKVDTSKNKSIASYFTSKK